MEIKDIKILIDLMRKNDLSVFKMEKEGFKITLKRGVDFQPLVASVTTAPAIQTAAPPSTASSPAAGAGETVAAPGREIVSPMVGTFYSAPSPEAEPYVRVGQAVTPDTVVCIIEAMKVMNEIKAEVTGVITEILVESAAPVQFGQPLFRVK